jgi:hypothetical protein
VKKGMMTGHQFPGPPELIWHVPPKGWPVGGRVAGRLRAVRYPRYATGKSELRKKWLRGDVGGLECERPSEYLRSVAKDS